MLSENLEKRITAITIQLRHADAKGVSTVAKSSYYRAASVLMCTIVEALVYELVRKNTLQNGHIIEQSIEHKQLHKIPLKVFSTPEDVFLCQKVTKDVHLDDNGVTFGKLNIYLKNKGIVTAAEYKSLNYVREERNKLHLQGLRSSDIGYTKSRFDKLSEPLNFLIPKI
jgi:hypothetical protein